MIVLNSYGQDTTLKIPDSEVVVTALCINRFQMPFDYLRHDPDEEDKAHVKTYGYLSSQQPDAKNYKTYYSLACAFWEVGNLKKAAQLFLTIFNSRDKFYSATDKHSSDVEGDLASALYGYGSYTSNYKNSAAIYLTKIYIEQQKFDSALSFLKDAEKKYGVSFSCGTGYRQQKNEYDFLYASIYEGQKEYDKVMELLLPECLERGDEIIVRTIKKLYSQKQVEEKLREAEDSMVFTPDTEPSYSYTMGYNADHVLENKDTVTYYKGHATIYLFGKKVNVPDPHLGNGERATKELYLKEFRETSFYESLRKEI